MLGIPAGGRLGPLQGQPGLLIEIPPQNRKEITEAAGHGGPHWFPPPPVTGCAGSEAWPWRQASYWKHRKVERERGKCKMESVRDSQNDLLNPKWTRMKPRWAWNTEQNFPSTVHRTVELLNYDTTVIVGSVPEIGVNWQNVFSGLQQQFPNLSDG